MHPLPVPVPVSAETPEIQATLKDVFRPGTVLDVTDVAASRGFTSRVGVSRLVDEQVLRVPATCPCESCESVVDAERRDRLVRLLGALESAIVGAEDGATEVVFLLDVPGPKRRGVRARSYVTLEARIVFPGVDGPAVVVTGAGEVHEHPLPFRPTSGSLGFGPSYLLGMDARPSARGKRS